MLIRPAVIRSSRPRWPVAINRSSSLAHGLVRCMPTAEVDILTGERPTDVTGNGRQLSVVPGHGLVTDLASASFQRITFTNVAAMSNVTAWTMSFWCRRRDSGSVISIGEVDDLDATKANYMVVNNDNTLQLIFNNNAPVKFEATWTRDSNLHHFVACFNADQPSATRGRIWLDGVELSCALTGTSPTVSPTTPNAFNFGYYQPIAIYPNGQMSDVWIWRRALSDTEIRSLWEPQTRWSLYTQAQPLLLPEVPIAELQVLLGEPMVGGSMF